MNICSYNEILYSKEIKTFNTGKIFLTEIKKNVKKSKISKKKLVKKSNIIYVVVKPQPGQVKGDWAVRDHRKIYSHHRIKLNAIKKARILGKKTNATVMVQKIDGTFGKGFKPKLNN